MAGKVRVVGLQREGRQEMKKPAKPGSNFHNNYYNRNNGNNGSAKPPTHRAGSERPNPPFRDRAVGCIKASTGFATALLRLRLRKPML